LKFLDIFKSIKTDLTEQTKNPSIRFSIVESLFRKLKPCVCGRPWFLILWWCLIGTRNCFWLQIYHLLGNVQIILKLYI